MTASGGPEGSTICPRCGHRSPVRLDAGRACATCESSDAWTAHDGSGARIVVDEAEIRRVEARVRAAAPRRRRLPRLALLALPLGSLGLSVAAALQLVAYYAPQPLGPFRGILERLSGAAHWAFLLATLALALAVAAIFVLRRSRDFRFLPLLLPTLAAGAAGLGATATSGVILLGSPGEVAWRFDTVPPVDEQGAVEPVLRGIQRSTVALLAPDADGDARNPALGTGAVVFASSNRAWVVTCSHVAMPYEAVGARRDPRGARPLWVMFADGRATEGRVRWTWRPPLDLALVEVAMDDPPPAVEVSSDTDALVPGSPVLFVPNPLREGWKVRRGVVLRRTLRRSPAGEVRLVRTDLPAIPGDSGSGLFDPAGRIVGINTWVTMGAGGPEAIALPAEAMRAMVDAIREGRLERLDEVFPEGILP
ncbi:MAG: trypsin-like peptidase domain-containing protein [Deltaproteobacteria bacterium]|nr:trypsin-like peptidase domain-containing protein [Deltaproteobacteria bacterium]